MLAACDRTEPHLQWTQDELAIIGTLWLGRLPEMPAAKGNPVADDPRAVELGHRLFFDKRLSANQGIACANCHHPQLQFTDGLPRAQGLGVTPRKSMSLVGSAFSPWQFWDGRRDSLWAQALQPLEDPREHGITRVEAVRVLSRDPNYRTVYEDIFGAFPDRDLVESLPSASPLGQSVERDAWSKMSPVEQSQISAAFANIGRALEAYQRQLQYGPSPFDEFVQAATQDQWATANQALGEQAQRGLRLFIGKANCIHCHNGPLLSNNEFHNTGLEGPGVLPKDRGRVDAVRKLLADEFNCLGPYSGVERQDCDELRFVKTSGIELVGAFRTVSLRNIAERPPYMHTGQFSTLEEVVEHYDRAQPTIISDELQPLNLSEQEKADLVAFLRSLSGPLATPKRLLSPPSYEE